MPKISTSLLVLLIATLLSTIFLIKLPNSTPLNPIAVKKGKQKTFNPFLTTTVWSENFNNECTADCLADTYGSWTIQNNVDGPSGTDPNNWFVSCAEEGITPPGCGSSCIGDASLHIGGNPGAGGDMGASFNEIAATHATFKMVVSPTISTVGQSNLVLKFDFIAFGSPSCTDDRAQLRLSTDGGATWPVAYRYCLNSVCCGSCTGYNQGQWTLYTLTLPEAFNNNPNVKIGFHWLNNGNGSGTDPSVAIDDIRIETVNADYEITTTSNSISIIDVTGTGETLDISQSASSIRFAVAGKSYSINGGTIRAFDTLPADIDLSGITTISVNTGVGNDIINVGAFSGSFPTLNIDGGTEDDVVNFNGSLNFTVNSSLNVNLQDDNTSPGVDAINVSNAVELILSGTGAGVFKASKNIAFNNGSVLRTTNGELIVEANQQTTPTSGDFTGIDIANGTIEATGTGIVTVKGKGGNASDAQRGINVTSGGKIFGGTTGTLTVDGRTQTTTGTNQNGVRVDGSTSKISSYGATVIVNAKRN